MPYAIEIEQGRLLDEERTVQRLFQEIETAFLRLDQLNDKTIRQNRLKDIAAKLNETKNAIREWEVVAKRTDTTPEEIATKKKELVATVNGYIQRKKDATEDTSVRHAAVKEQAASTSEITTAEMSTQQLMNRGRKQQREIEESLYRSEKVVQQSIEIGTKTAEQLNDQTRQLERIVDNLDEMTFTMKKAQRAIRDITRAIATDKCILSLMLLVVLGVIAAIVVKVVKPGNQVTIPRVQDVLAWNATRRLY